MVVLVTIAPEIIVQAMAVREIIVQVMVVLVTIVLERRALAPHAPLFNAQLVLVGPNSLCASFDLRVLLN